MLKNYNFLEENKTFFDVSLKKLYEINTDNKKYTSIFKNYYLDEDILDKFTVLFENPIFI